jgi:hypothetical protein
VPTWRRPPYTGAMSVEADVRVVLRRADGSGRVLAVLAPLPPRLTLDGVTYVRGLELDADGRPLYLSCPRPRRRAPPRRDEAAIGRLTAASMSVRKPFDLRLLRAAGTRVLTEP